MNLLKKLYTVISWTLVGLMSSYVVAALYTFSYMFFLMALGGGNYAAWLRYTLIYGAGTGFLVGLITASGIVRK